MEANNSGKGFKRRLTDPDWCSIPSSSNTSENGYLDEQLSYSHHEIKPCTSEWTRGTLQNLSITPILDEIHSPYELIDMAFSESYLMLLDPKIDERVSQCRERIMCRSPLQRIDIDDIEKLNKNVSYNLLFEIGEGMNYMKVNEWDVAPTWNVIDIIEDRLFHVYGESFTERLIDIFIILKSGDKNVSEHRYQALFQSFIGALGLSTFGDPDVIGREILIGDVQVNSVPNIVFPCFGHSDESMKIMAVCKVKKNFNGHEEFSSAAKRRRVQTVNHLDDNLIGQHGGELLTHFKMSQNLHGLLGFVVQKTWVTFTYLRFTKKQYEKIVSGDESSKESCPEIYYSRPYNYLSIGDRNEILGPLLKLGFIQSTPISNH
ncbi:hypothetical protein FSP39_023757 [Pinctada imbricata]|uniref:Uncharacterized protein n=1 Tax=Pinctada imbricata TaxID=66713 RepID=A0AA89C350_PINIB|nr:hypothetical protein FSP39_023757 [Pinctada imbricata]